MNEEIEFLREHIKGICSYKGLQQELTYDISLDILKRVCLAFDYLQQENKQLKEENAFLKQLIGNSTTYSYGIRGSVNKELEEGVK